MLIEKLFCAFVAVVLSCEIGGTRRPTRLQTSGEVFADEEGNEDRTQAEAYVEAFCEQALVRARCEILERRAVFLETELAAPVQAIPRSPRLRGQSLFREEVQSILSDARVAAIPIMTRYSSATAPEIRETLEDLKDSWRSIRDTLYQIEETRASLCVETWAESNWQTTWTGFKVWYWLGTAVAVIVFGVYAVWEFGRGAQRFFRSGRLATKFAVGTVLVIVFVLVLCACVATYSWIEGIAPPVSSRSIETSTSESGAEAEIVNLEEEKAKWTAEYDTLLAKYQELNRDWERRVYGSLPYSTRLPAQLREFRRVVWNMEAELRVADEVQTQMETDASTLERVRAEISEDEANEIRQVKNLASRYLKGAAIFLAVTFLGISTLAYINDWRGRSNETICPACGVSGKLKRLGGKAPRPQQRKKGKRPKRDKPPDASSAQQADDIPEVPTLKCEAIIRGRGCGYEFAADFGALPKLCVPTCGLTSAGKTLWLAMTFRQLSRGSCPTRARFEKIKSDQADEIEGFVEGILGEAELPKGTQTDHMPQPVVFKVHDRMLARSSSTWLSLLDYPGEMTELWSLKDARKRRAFHASGILYFLDPTKSRDLQYDKLQTFIQQLHLARKAGGHPERIPMAVCLSKIDELPRLCDENDHTAVDRFHKGLRDSDPGNDPISYRTVRGRTKALKTLWNETWPRWKLEQLVREQFRGPYRFFPLTPIGLERGDDTNSKLGEADLKKRTLAPVGLLEPLLWLLHVNGINSL